jgi:hypothetical protein
MISEHNPPTAMREIAEAGSSRGSLNLPPLTAQKPPPPTGIYTLTIPGETGSSCVIEFIGAMG